ncbi:PREDICTED: ras-related protein Rab-24 [Dinoponera quadriceps]|uniref:Ras-related protein Rab-24 n=1 Tax=Dinoponera quadriceps TaxID=609295 RepID=A0A6P3Y244_DINQU|nr:PREDICTED: ras-related protein Rab-24 [Dinoponera quadriceps]
MSHSDYLQEELTIVLLGESGVGKTKLVIRYLVDVLKETKTEWDSAMGAVHVKRTMQVDGVSFNMVIWDTSGDKKYDSMAAMYYLGRTAVIICCDISNSYSFVKAKDWALQLTIHSCKIYLCATKNDLCDEIETATLNNIQEYAENIKAKFFVTSSHTGENISELFHTIIEDFISAPCNRKEIKKQKRRRKHVNLRCFWNYQRPKTEI